VPNGNEAPAMFALGTSNKEKPEKKTNEQRMGETFGTGDGNVKRDREKFAVDLRKKKREEYFKEKRAQTSTAQNVN